MLNPAVALLMTPAWLLKLVPHAFRRLRKDVAEAINLNDDKVTEPVDDEGGTVTVGMMAVAAFVIGGVSVQMYKAYLKDTGRPDNLQVRGVVVQTVCEYVQAAVAGTFHADLPKLMPEPDADSGDSPARDEVLVKAALAGMERAGEVVVKPTVGGRGVGPEEPDDSKDERDDKEVDPLPV